MKSITKMLKIEAKLFKKTYGALTLEHKPRSEYFSYWQGLKTPKQFKRRCGGVFGEVI